VYRQQANTVMLISVVINNADLVLSISSVLSHGIHTCTEGNFSITPRLNVADDVITLKSPAVGNLPELTFGFSKLPRKCNLVGVSAERMY
jgi:hypothetical protein